ncbi:hypothetical protein [Granulicoccus sp. GXG6511]|uniref:hypothetical protein n=1 Tax=Granulicoccus sp. GXG6511 TaxID=3381351 RepID=UPI003D7C9DC8
MTTQQRSSRAYLIRFLTAAVLYTVLILISLPLSQRQPEGSVLRYVLACLPVVGVAVGIWALWRYIREADEFQARKLLDSLAISVAGTILVTFCIGMIQTAGGPALPWVWVIPVWAVFFGAGSAWTGWKHR